MAALWRKHSLTIVLLVVMAAQTGYCMWSGAYTFTREQPFGPTMRVWTDAFWVWWTFEYHMSLVADVFGGLVLIVATKHLRERGSPESGEEDEKEKKAKDQQK